jgi:GNAT superfamily N-acetyltransferase
MIRRATADDADVLEEMDRACFPDDKLYGLFRWDRGVAWIAVEGDSHHHYTEPRPTGYIAAHPMTRGRWFFSRVGVMPYARGAGLQRRLMAVLEKHGRREGWRELVTYTAGFNGWSTENILRCGWHTYRPAKSYVGYAVVHLRKRLR